MSRPKNMRLTEKQIEELAVEIRKFLLKHKMWQDVNIYFNHKRFGCKDPETGKYFYNDRAHLFVEENIEPQTYFEYVNPDHILSMSFEGPVCEMLYYETLPSIKRKFDAIFERYGLYYELGNHWNFSCYYKEEWTMEYLSEDKKTINLPVPLGSIVYEAVTKCGDFCLFQEQKFDSIFPKTDGKRCGGEMPCHTICRGCSEHVLSINNLGMILEGWGVWYFATKEEAEAASARIAAEHTARMKEFGFFVRDDGYGKTADADEE